MVARPPARMEKKLLERAVKLPMQTCRELSDTHT
jgi:hypothetical protein